MGKYRLDKALRNLLNRGPLNHSAKILAQNFFGDEREDIELIQNEFVQIKKCFLATNKRAP